MYTMRCRHAAAKFTTPRGTRVQVSLDKMTWRWHTTRKELQFSSYVNYNGGAYIFREGKWLVSVTVTLLQQHN